MEARARVVVTVMALSVLAAVAWLLVDRELQAPNPAAPLEAAPTDAPAAPSAPATADATAATKLEAAVVEDAAESAPRVQAPLVDAKLATLRGRCVDEHGAPLAGCKVSLHGWQGNSQSMDAWLKDHAEEPAWQDPPAVTTAADGVFVFPFWPPPPFQFALDVRLEGRGAKSGRWGTIAEGSTKDVGDVVLSPGVRVSGRVVDEQGAPQEKEYVTLQRERTGRWSEGMEDRSSMQAASKADGSFAMRDWLAPGDYTIRTNRAELQSPKTVRLTAERSEESLTVVVRTRSPSDTIRGRVVDEAGTPVRGIEIADRSASGHTSTHSGRDGLFELARRRAEGGTTATLVLYSLDHDVEEAPRAVAWGTTDVEFRVRKGASLTLRVTDERGAPVDSYLVRLVPCNRTRFTSTDSEPRAKGHHENGTVVIQGLTRGDWLLMVEFATASGLGGIVQEFTQDAGDKRFDLRADALLRRALQVVGPDGPVAGTTVQLCTLFGQPLTDDRTVMPLVQWLWNAGRRHALVLWEGTTNGEGRVELVGPRGRDLGVCVLGAGHVPARLSPVALEPKEELVVTVSRGAQLVGTIVPPLALAELKRLAGAEPGKGFPDGEAPRLSLRREREVFPKDHGLAQKKQDLQIHDDGTFRIDGLPTGAWQVQVAYWVAHGQGATGRSLPADHVTLVDGATTTIELDLSALLPGAVEGSVHHNGQPLANGSFALQGERDGSIVKTDAQGRFRTDMLPGDYKAVLGRQNQGRGDPEQWTDILCATPVRVTRGQLTSVALSFASSTVRATVLDHAGKPVAGIALQAHDGERFGARGVSDDQGVAEFLITTGTVQLRVLPKALSTSEAQRKLWQEARANGIQDPLAQHWITLQTVALVAGQTTKVEVRLPESAGY